VRELMTRDVISVRRETSVNEVAKLMHRNGVSGVPVLAEGGEVAGIVTELDLIVRNGRLEMPVFLQVFDANIPLELPGHLRARLRHVLGTRAEDVMTSSVHCVDPDTEVEDLVKLMVDRGSNPVPVVENGRLAGIVSRSDIIRMMAAELGEA
jgi:CBS domain-containing protein